MPERTHSENPAIADLISRITDVLNERNLQDERRLQHAQRESGPATAGAILLEAKDMVPDCYTLALQLLAIFDEHTGDSFFVYHAADPEIPKDKVFRIPRGRQAEGVLMKRLGRTKYIEHAANSCDALIFRELQQNTVDQKHNILPALVLTYYLAEDEAQEGESTKEPTVDKNYYFVPQDGVDEFLSADRVKRAAHSIQCLKLICSSYNDDQIISAETINQFPSRCNLALAFFSSTVSSMALSGINKKRAEAIIRRTALLGDIPHNFKNHIIPKIRADNSDALESVREYLHRRAVYLAYMSKFADVSALDAKAVGEKREYIATEAERLPLRKVISEFKALRIGLEALPTDWQSQYDNIVSITNSAGENADDNCCILRGALENALENLCFNSFQHGRPTTIDTFKIQIAVKAAEREGFVDVIYRDTGNGFDGDSLGKVSHRLRGNEVDFQTGKGQGLWSIGLSIEAIGGTVAFAEKEQCFTLHVPRSMLAQVVPD